MTDARTFLIHGLIAGLLAGIAAFAVAATIGEPPIDAAIAVEEGQAGEQGHSHAHGEEDTAGGHSHGDEEGGITRGQQAGPGLATATIALSTVIGGLVGIGAAVAAGRLGRLGIVGSTTIVAAVGFVSFALVPWIAYPPNPPATGNGETIGERTAVYFSFVIVSVVAACGAVALARTLARRGSLWVAVVLPVAGYVAVAVLAFAVFGSIDEVPDEFPANTLYSFRMGALATQATLWAVLTIALTGLIQRTTSHKAVAA
ncbi:hypothetical protein BHE97_16660 [Aeromicrobium sp. PE09-221]|uniref:CbtA family protein n=1 Tax=Aeromicrobium sp. PE09-221 TaxID=1898043 RepID=UPI000B3ED954|nr:CbtA family protein [Aeromicrobium sp. PE09-221]OUZ07575.1 hypothetical protein BHE97_16660 [Aeromicrobium sp. PE09-221]